MWPFTKPSVELLDKLLIDMGRAMPRLAIALDANEEAPPYYGWGLEPPPGHRWERDSEYRARLMATE